MFMFTSSLYWDFIVQCSFFLYVNYFELFILTILSFSLWSLLINQSFRYKFIYFFLFLASLSILGFWLSYDGIVLMMLLTEFLVILLFLLVFLSFKFNSKNNLKNSKFFFVYYSILLAIYLFSLVYTTSKQFSIYNFIYAYNLDVISNDLFLFYHFFFIEAPLVVIFIAFILGLISIFFVAVYYCFRFMQQRSAKTTHSVLILRKQLLNKQGYFKPQMRVFQK